MVAGFKSDGVKGALQSLAQNIANKFEQKATDALSSALFGATGGGGKGGSGGGLLTGFFSSLFMSTGGIVPQYLASGGVAGGPKGSDTVPAWLTPGEVVLNAAQQKNLASMGGSNVTINISGNVDQRAINQIKQVVASDPTMIHQLATNGQQSTTGLGGIR